MLKFRKKKIIRRFAKDTILTFSEEHKFLNCNLIMFLISSILHEGRCNVVGIMLKLRTGCPKNRFSIRIGCQTFLSSQIIPDLLWGPPSSLLQKHVGLFPGIKVAGA